MKRVLLTTTIILAFILVRAQNTDLPNPTANLQTLPNGSYVIAMDNSLQVNSSADFNLKAYGLVVYLLNNNVRVKWSIKAGKLKDGADFTTNADQFRPSFVAGGAAKNFKGGPFVIFASDTSGVASLIDAFYTSSAITGLDRPQVYRTTTAVANVDIRYDLSGFIPKAAILTDGGNQGIHVSYMTEASVPTSNYLTSAGADLLTTCVTFASEPHNTKTGTAVNAAITAIRNFVSVGGNFLAQCEAIDNYENNPLGRFQTTGGIKAANVGIGTGLLYPNPDLSFSQFEGAYNGSQGGSLKNWRILGSRANNEHDHATGDGTDTDVIGASVSKLFSGKGGLVFYIGNHSFANNTLVGINGIRMYMNAFLTPSNTDCPSSVFKVLPLKLEQFTAQKSGDLNLLKWTISSNDKADRFEIQKSVDGIHFSAAAVVFASQQVYSETYSFKDMDNTDGTVYYRLAMVNKDQSLTYSSIISLKSGILTSNALKLTQNPVESQLQFFYNAPANGAAAITIYNLTGAKIYSAQIDCKQGTNEIALNIQGKVAPGFYILEAAGNATKVTSKFIKK
jgi:hypothetical protein